MSLWYCPNGHGLFGPNAGHCAKCGTPLQYYAPRGAETQPATKVTVTQACTSCLAKQVRIAQLEEELSDWKTGKCRCYPWEGVHTTDCPASAKQLNEFLKQAKADVLVYRDKAVEYQDKYNTECRALDRTPTDTGDHAGTMLEKTQAELKDCRRRLREAYDIIQHLKNS